MTKIYIVGEDEVTRAVLRRVILFCNKNKNIETISELPARGGQIKAKLKEFNNLATAYPVVLLTDLDTHSCALELLQNWFPEEKNDRFIVNIAVDEAEAWLMADREGFADYFAVDLKEIPNAEPMKQGGNKALTEMPFPCKASLYLMKELIQKSRNGDFKKQLTPKNGAKKGPEYNTCLVPYIRNKWDIRAAQKNSDSLDRMIKRISEL